MSCAESGVPAFWEGCNLNRIPGCIVHVTLPAVHGKRKIIPKKEFDEVANAIKSLIICGKNKIVLKSSTVRQRLPTVSKLNSCYLVG